MVGCPHGHGGHGLRPAPRPAHQGADAAATRAPEPRASATARRSPSAERPPTPSPSRSPRRESGAPPARTPDTTPSERPGPSPATSGRVRGYDTAGGRAVFDLGRTSASLVSATPAAGWSMQVWKTEAWIRVEFTSGAQRVSVFCTWHDGPPRVEIGSY